MKTIIILPAILLLILSSCKKDKDTPTNCDKTVAAIAGIYSVQKLEVGVGGVFIDVTSQLDACEKDDKLTLKADGTTLYQDLGIVCSPSGNASGTWSISSNGKMTIHDNGGSGDIDTAEITSFDCTTLVLTGSDSNSPGDQVRLTIKR
ncbi:MAG: lipocalin family protein [Ferruginibacter sp.]